MEATQGIVWFRVVQEYYEDPFLQSSPTQGKVRKA